MNRLDSRLHAVVGELYPALELTEDTLFRPIPDLSKGEVSSSAAIRIAAAQKSDAQVVAIEIAIRMADVAAAEFSAQNGFIVARGRPNELWSDLIRDAEQEFRIATGSVDLAESADAAPSIVIAARADDPDLPLYARYRLLALAATHALAALSIGRSCVVDFCGDAERTCRTIDDLLATVKGSLTVVARAGQNVRGDNREVGSIDGAPLESRVRRFVWLHHRSRARANFRGGDGKTILRMPNDGWLLSRERTLPEALSVSSVEKIVSTLATGNDLLRWILHGSSPVQSGEFDPYVAMLNERSSPAWAISALADRVRRIVPEALQREAARSVVAPCRVELDGMPRSHWLASVFLPSYVARAAAWGEVPELAAAIDRFTISANRSLNSPKLRMELESGELPRSTAQIVAGLVFGLSSILPLSGVEGDVSGSTG